MNQYFNLIKNRLNPAKQLFIKQKWHKDKKKLPLVDLHWDLYKTIHNAYFGNFRRFPNLVNPSTYNDCIQWLKLFDQRSEIVRCSDKIQVRDYVEKRIGNTYLLEQYGVYESFDLVDLSKLPNAFVIKSNHDSGSVLMVRNKENLIQEECVMRFNHSLSKKYGVDTGEWAYAFIRPAILVEEYLEPERATPVPDYKFHCVNGNIKWVQYIYDRNHGTKEAVVDAEGNLIGFQFDHKMHRAENFEKPSKWDALCDIAMELSSGWKYVRVDLYLSSEKIYFGELTFFPLGGFYRGDGQKRFGEMMKFDFSKCQAPCYKEKLDV